MTDQLFNASTWLLDRHVEEGRGDRTAVLSGDRSLTYAGLLAEVEEVAAGLRGLGVRPEERIAMVMLDSPEFAVMYLGALRIGAVALPINPLLPGRDLGVIVADARARLVVVSSERAASVVDLVAGAPDVERVVLTGETDGIGLDVPTHSWADLLAAGAGYGSDPYTTWYESPGFWLCTSGSTGRPKLAMHRHGDLHVTNETYARSVLAVTDADVCFSVGPMFHAYGLGNSLTFPLAAGAATVLEPTRPPTPELVADVVDRHQVTLFFCIPTFYAALNASGIADDTFVSVRWGVSAAEPLPAETFTRFRQRFGVEILDGIGSTEMLHIYLSNQPGIIRPGTSGQPVPGYEIRLVSDDGADVEGEGIGQLLVRGDSMTQGYWCRNEMNRATFEGEWMRTGDVYGRDADGFCAYLGRVDDMLRVGGEWVSPAEVEGVLIEHSDVLEAAVVGVRDDAGVLRPVAHVIPAAGVSADGLDDRLNEHCRARLAGYKRPKEYQFTAELPKTATGKIQRFRLRD